MDSFAIILSVILFAVILPSAASTTGQDVKYPVYYNHKDIAEFIITSCNVTLYPQLCVSSLSSYAGPLKAKQTDLVKAAMTVSLLNARNVSLWAAALKDRSTAMSVGEKAALKDCVQNFKDSADQIKGSLAELQHLKGHTFRFQMSNVQTWMSAALTDQDSCLDGFQDVTVKRNVTAMVTGRVQNECKLISNALALVNRFATTGGGYN